MAKLELVTPPTGRVITENQLGSFGRIEAPDEDTDLQRLIDEATEAAENYTWRKMLTQVWDESLDGFTSPLRLRHQPVQSIGSTGVTYVDNNGDTQTLADTVWELGQVNGISVVRLKFDQTWPSTRAHADVVTVRYTCGYGDADDVPDGIKAAIRMHAIHRYEFRDGTPVPVDFKNRLSSYSVRHWVPG